VTDVTELREISARVRQNLEAAVLISQQAAAVQAEMKELTGVAQSANRFVRVEVDYRGFVTGLTFAPSATEASTGTLGQDVLETTQAAIADLQEKARPIRAKLAVDPQTIIAQDDIAEKLDAIAQRLLSIDFGDKTPPAPQTDDTKAGL